MRAVSYWNPGRTYCIEPNLVMGATVWDVVDVDFDEVVESFDTKEQAEAWLRDEEDSFDPTPWCSGCGAMKRSDCHCGPIAENN